MIIRGKHKAYHSSLPFVELERMIRCWLSLYSITHYSSRCLFLINDHQDEMIQRQDMEASTLCSGEEVSFSFGSSLFENVAGCFPQISI